MWKPGEFAKQRGMMITTDDDDNHDDDDGDGDGDVDVDVDADAIAIVDVVVLLRYSYKLSDCFLTELMLLFATVAAVCVI